MKSKGSANKKRRDTTKTVQNSNNQKSYMVVPYYRGLSRSLKKVCNRQRVQVYFKGGNTIKNLLVERPRSNLEEDMGQSIDTNVIGWIVMKNTLESPQEFLERGSRNIRRHLPQYLTILTPLVSTSPLIILL